MEEDYEVLMANLRELASTEHGAAVIWHILSFCALYDISPPKDSRFYDGRRAVGIDILRMLDDADPKIYPKLILQNLEKDE